MLKLMIVEDDPMVRNINERFVQKINQFEVVASVADTEEAKSYLMKHEVHLILLDVFLPSGSGLDFLKWIREEQLKCDVILITAEKRLDCIQEAFRYGVVDYLVKPFTFSRFQEALTHFLMRFDKLSSEQQVEQEFIDKYLRGVKEVGNAPKEKVKKNQELKRGLNINTYQQIIQFFEHCQEDLSAEEIADQVGLARVTVRRYLDYMVSVNEVSLIRVYGKVGRPIHLYRRVVTK